MDHAHGVGLGEAGADPVGERVVVHARGGLDGQAHGYPAGWPVGWPVGWPGCGWFHSIQPVPDRPSSDRKSGTGPREPALPAVGRHQEGRGEPARLDLDVQRTGLEPDVAPDRQALFAQGLLDGESTDRL